MPEDEEAKVPEESDESEELEEGELDLFRDARKALLAAAVSSFAAVDRELAALARAKTCRRPDAV
jgi:hypothetical protein